MANVAPLGSERVRCGKDDERAQTKKVFSDCKVQQQGKDQKDPECNGK